MVKKILAVVAVVILGFVAFVATRPAEFVYLRKTTISAPPEVIFATLADFHNWRNWSPWDDMDPKMERKYEGTPAGQGAIYSWKGNDKVGEGRMTITEAKPNDFIAIKLEFLKPFEATNITTFTLTPGAATEVVWKMEGKNAFVSKAAGVFMNMDKMIGDDFEKGLAKLKALTEAKAKEAPAPAVVEVDAGTP